MSCCGESMEDARRAMGVPSMPRGPEPVWRWQQLDPEVEAKVQKCITSWLDTPYMPGQRARKMGVDCAQLVPGFLDMASGKTEPTPLPRQAADSGIHSIRPGLRSIKHLRKAYEGHQIRDYTIEPGDILVMRATADGSGPKRIGHALIAGVQPQTAMHAVKSSGVCMTSLSGLTQIVRAYRLLHKESWAVR